MRRLELLAPARNLECGKAAIDHGADAVYIGASQFGARVAAGNSVDAIRELCHYAHKFGARVYVTVNTIVYDSELDALFGLLSALDEAGADAVLVQDMALSPRSLQHIVPSTCRIGVWPVGLSFHASTQTDNRTAEKVRWLRDEGFSRVVLARELSLSEISAIHRDVPDVELEVFVHGSLCVSYSGLCYASQYCFGRSANRGECAQFCRMPFSLVDAGDTVLQSGRHLLSLKDLNQSDHLLELAEAGATSFKIEGRLKDVFYVKNVTAAYSQKLDEIVKLYPDRYCRASLGRVSYGFHPDLHKTFNRGYTTYFLHGRQPDIASFDTPKAIGEPVGTVKDVGRDWFTVAGTARFANGDGLCFLYRHQLVGMRANRVVDNRIYPFRMPAALRPGVRLYRNSDQELERLLSRQSAERRIPVSISMRATEAGFSLASSGVSINYACEHVEASKPPLENIFRQLSKLGDTIYECSGVEVPPGFNYFIPNSVLSDMRRRLVAALDDSLLSPRRPAPSWPPAVSSKLPGRLPHYPLAYLNNISNVVASCFYDGQGLSHQEQAFELQVPLGRRLVMQCRHCLRYSLGFCVKHGGRRATWREPLSLVLGDGRRFRLEFDCGLCQMNVYGE